jgi:hypothetical protein
MPKLRVHRHEVTQPLDTPYRLIPLTQGQNAIVDAEDFARLMEINWYAHWCKETKTFYADGRINGKYVSMHSVIMGGIGYDHKNRDTLDNRKENLRKCTRAQNMQNRTKFSRNTTGFKGVYKTYKWFQAKIGWQCKMHNIGLFKTAEAAALAYDFAARKLHGQFAILNILKS